MARNKGQRDLNTALAFGRSNKALHPNYAQGAQGRRETWDLAGFYRRGRAKALHPGLRALRAGA